MKKIAVASEGKMVAGHFGHCEGFTFFTVTEEEITDTQFVNNPGHRPGFIPNYLNELGIKVIISGGMGSGAIEIFNEKGIEVITGATGEIKKVVQQFLEGSLVSTARVCRQHQHQGNCGGHEV